MKPKIAISLLVFIFVGPIVVSWFFVNSDIDWTSRGLSNHGELIRPAINLRDIDEITPLFDFATLAPSHWALISLEESPCEQACFERIEKMKVLHSVMGSSKERLRVFAVAPSAEVSNEHLLSDVAINNTLKATVEKQIKGINYPQYFVFDWRKQLMMHFQADTPSADIKKDLSKLLRASKIR
jgi:hypothetical protein